MKNPGTQPQDKYVLRFPEGLRDQIKASAEANNRSMNAEIVARLEGQGAADEIAALQAQLLHQAGVIEALRWNFEVIAEQLTAGVAGNREKAAAVLSALRILGRKVPK